MMERAAAGKAELNRLLLEHAEKGNVSKVRALLRRGADPEAADEEGRTMRHIATAHIAREGVMKTHPYIEILNLWSARVFGRVKRQRRP